MTPEQELEQLIAEQARDDTHFVYPQRGAISFDKTYEMGEGGSFTLHDLTYLDEDGFAQVGAAGVIGFRRLTHGRSPFLGSVPHGSASTYSNLACRCPACRQAATDRMRNWYARNRKRAVETRTCRVCESPFETNKSLGVYCSKRCKKKAWDRSDAGKAQRKARDARKLAELRELRVAA